MGLQHPPAFLNHSVVLPLFLFFVPGLDSLAQRLPRAESLPPALKTGVPSVKQQHRHLDSRWWWRVVCQKYLFFNFLLLPASARIPWLVATSSSLCLCLHVAFSTLCVSMSFFSHGIQSLTSLPFSQTVIILFSFLPPALPPFLPSSKHITLCPALCWVLGDQKPPKQAEPALWKLIVL